MTLPMTDQEQDDFLRAVEEDERIAAEFAAREVTHPKYTTPDASEASAVFLRRNVDRILTTLGVDAVSAMTNVQAINTLDTSIRSQTTRLDDVERQNVNLSKWLGDVADVVDFEGPIDTTMGEIFAGLAEQVQQLKERADAADTQSGVKLRLALEAMATDLGFDLAAVNEDDESLCRRIHAKILDMKYIKTQSMDIRELHLRTLARVGVKLEGGRGSDLQVADALCTKTIIVHQSLQDVARERDECRDDAADLAYKLKQLKSSRARAAKAAAKPARAKADPKVVDEVGPVDWDVLRQLVEMMRDAEVRIKLRKAKT